MIRLNHVSKIYGDGSKKAVDDLSWDIEDGKITGFIGPNGAGKTTTLKMITGILAPSEGTIEINGKDIQKDPLEAKRQFGFVPDDPDAFLRVRGIEYLNFMADIYGVGTDVSRSMQSSPEINSGKSTAPSNPNSIIHIHIIKSQFIKW